MSTYATVIDQKNEPLFCVTANGSPKHMVPFLYSLLREATEKFSNKEDAFVFFIGKVAVESSVDYNMALFEYADFSSYIYRVNFDDLTISWEDTDEDGNRVHCRLSITDNTLEIEERKYTFNTIEELEEII